MFNPETLDDYHKFRKIPPSSSPYNIYYRFCEDVINNDLHSLNIENNRKGLRQGALKNYKAGIITDIELVKINQIIDSAEIADFSPLVYLIPEQKVSGKIQLVDVDASANPLSIEYQIHQLEEDEYDIIKFR